MTGLHVPGNGVQAEEQGLAADPTTVIGRSDHPTLNKTVVVIYQSKNIMITFKIYIHGKTSIYNSSISKM